MAQIHIWIILPFLKFPSFIASSASGFSMMDQLRIQYMVSHQVDTTPEILEAAQDDVEVYPALVLITGIKLDSLYLVA